MFSTEFIELFFIHVTMSKNTETHYFQCLNFNNFLNLGGFQKNCAYGGSMNKYTLNGISEVILCVDNHTCIHTFNFIADVCLCF